MIKVTNSLAVTCVGSTLYGLISFAVLESYIQQQRVLVDKNVMIESKYLANLLKFVKSLN